MELQGDGAEPVRVDKALETGNPACKVKRESTAASHRTCLL